MQPSTANAQTPRKNRINYIDIFAVFLLSLLFLLFPLSFSTLTTDFSGVPKQLLLGAVVLLLLLLLAGKLVSLARVRLSRTPFDLPILFLGLAVLLSSVFSLNRYESLLSAIPFLFSLTVFFLVVNFARRKFAGDLLTVSFIIGADLLSILAILSLAKIYVLTLALTKSQFFTPIGSLLDQAIYTALALPLSAMSTWLLIRSKADKENFHALKLALFGISTLLITSGLLVTIYNLTLQKPPLLPYQVGFQTAFAAISQDTQRTLQSFLFGSGFGTFASDFTRFKLASFNQAENLWNLLFIRSSSFALELIATIGLLGFASFLFLIVTVVRQAKKTILENYVAISVLVSVLAALLLPLSFVTQTALFFILSLFAIKQRALLRDRFFDIELRFLALRSGIQWQSVPAAEKESPARETNKLAAAWFIATIVLVGVLGFFAYRYFASDLSFQKSLVAASSNKGQETYNQQINAIRLFPYRDTYHRIYSQTNLALANSLASSTREQNASPSAQVQQTIVGLIQQSINAGRTATTLSPLTSANWQNLASIYRGLIGFGQNAENFAVVAQQQAVRLDPSNPAQYLSLGGIYYQLRLWDDAIRQFQIAASLKPDFANAYYNLGHALEQKGELTQALDQYRRVQNLVRGDKTNLERLTKEIEALEKKIGSGSSAQTSNNTGQSSGASAGQQLEISTPSAQLPKQREPIKIPPPSISTQSAQ